MARVPALVLDFGVPPAPETVIVLVVVSNISIGVRKQWRLLFLQFLS